MAAFEASGLSQVQFTKKRRLSPSAFRYYLYKIRKQAAVPGFVRVQTPSDRPLPAATVIMGSVRVELGGRPDASYVAELVHALGGVGS